jgi:hypothetical protein
MLQTYLALYSTSTHLRGDPSLVTNIRDNYIKMNLRGIGWNGMEWIDLVQERDQCRVLVNTVMNLRVP